MSYTKRALESTDPSFQCSTKIEMTASDIMLSAEWDMSYERLRDEEEARSRALGIDQEGAALRSANQQQEPKLTRPEQVPPPDFFICCWRQEGVRAVHLDKTRGIWPPIKERSE